MKIGMLVTAHNGGIGTLAREFARHLRPEKCLIIDYSAHFAVFPERYKDFATRTVSQYAITPEVQDWVLDGIDVLLAIETFYNDDIVRRAKEKGVKTALVTMCEMSQEKLPINPDLFICPSTLDYKMMPNPKVYLPIPLATDKLVWRERKEANVFIHTASHGGMNGRKGTSLLIAAMKYVKSDIKVIINSWIQIGAPDPRIEVRYINFRDYWQCWQGGDVLIYPQDYNGICLPVSEAFASGLGLVTTNIYPFNEWLPKEVLFEPSGFYKTRAGNGLMEVDAAKIDPKIVAAKIDEIAGKDISHISALGKKYAEENSWDVLKPKYLECLRNLCNK